MFIPSHRLQSGGEPGVNCLAMCAWLLGDQVDIIATRVRFATARGTSPFQLVSIAGSMGMLARILRIGVEDLNSLNTPAVLQWGRGRYVVLAKKAAAGRLRIFDPALGWRSIPLSEARERFTGVVLELSRAADFKRRTEKPALSAWSLVTFDRDLIRSLARLLITSILVQIYIVAGPLYARTIIDEVIPNGDTGLLTSVAIAFGLACLFDLGAGLLRSLAVQHVDTALGWQITRSLFRHLLSLPLAWFQARGHADVLQKLETVDSVRTLIQQACSALLVDGLVALACAVMLLLTAPGLAWVSLGLFCVYAAVRLIAVPINRRLQTRTIHASVLESGHRMETVRSIQSIKSMASEEAREAQWSSKFADSLQTRLDSVSIANVFQHIQSGAGNLASITFMGIGALQVIEGHLTLGTLMAAVIYNTQLVTRASSIFDQYIAWRMMDVHLSRIGDIALTDREKGFSELPTARPDIRGAFEVRDLEFRYNASDPPVLANLSFEVHAGEHVVFTGPSGIGKSTLMKLLCGLYEPSGGSITLDGKPFSAWGPRAVRSAIGVVLQNDDLLSGSVFDNVTFFDPTPDAEWAWQCLDDAGLRQEVERMPLGPETPVGEMGLALSGGQKQRLLLARVLYKRPAALILDEATSHLDVARESQILAMLRARKITVISVAHRPDAIRSADRQVSLGPVQHEVVLPSAPMVAG